jgi:hypothetical protein
MSENFCSTPGSNTTNTATFKIDREDAFLGYSFSYAVL